ncbi:MAG: hypothetical protein K2O89_00890 [Clostridia bacterium]|nr:hypothetical protein [Clostridia bacterium]
MTQVEKLLKYQETDEKLLKLERDLGNSDERKNFVQAKSFLTKAPEKLDALEAKAVELAALVSELNKKYQEIAETLSDFDHIDEMVDGGADISFYKKNVTQISDRLKSIKSEVASLTKAVKEADEEYQQMKKKTIDMQKQYTESSEAYKKLKESLQGEALTVKKELDALQKGIEPEAMKKYEVKRSERIFPILCAENGGRCSKCGSELSLADKEKISSGSIVECDNCHRILYKG